MSHSLNISEALRRPIQNGSSFSGYIKETNCKAFSYGNGNNSTVEGVEYMADMIEKSSHQVKKLAQKLQKSNLQSTVTSVHNFLTSYIQYNADAKLQRLRSPGCTWSVRNTGVDCKSFSIFAGSLLKEMGISFVIRQVKQPSFYPEQFTHVYVVVPQNQKITSANQLTSYYNLDATVLDNKEVSYSAKKDKFMNGLPYQGMMAPSVSDVSETKESQNFQKSFREFENVGFDRVDLIKMKNYMKALQKSYGKSVFMVPGLKGIYIHNGAKEGKLFAPFTLKKWQEFFIDNVVQLGLGIDPMTAMMVMNTVGGSQGGGEGGQQAQGADVSSLFGDDLMGSITNLFGSTRSAYKPEFVVRDGELLYSILQKNTEKINQAVRSKNMTALGDAVADFRLNNKLFLKSASFVRNRRSWNRPTEETLDLLIRGIRELNTKTNEALDSWLNQYFQNIGTLGTKSKSSSVFQNDPSQVNFTIFYPHSTDTQTIPSFSLKSDVQSVKSFSIENEGSLILQNPNTGQTNTGSVNNNSSTGSGSTQNFTSGVQKGSFVPGFSNTALIATGGTLVAGYLLWPQISGLLKNLKR